MAGLLKPYDAYNLIKRLKSELDLPIHMQCHATTGMSTATYLKSIEAGVDNVDAAISSMSMTYGHSSTEAIVAILQNTERDTGIDLAILEEIAAYFRKIRKKYSRFEGSLKGTDSRILVSQVPGGMLTNLENQLREQDSAHRIDEVLEEIPRVRKDLGYIPLVTPTSQIVGTQAVINILLGERYKNIAKETEGVLKGEYGATPVDVDKKLQARVLGGEEPISCRPADLLSSEFARLEKELLEKGKESDLIFSENLEDDVLTYALFPQVAIRFFENRGNPAAFETAPKGEEDIRPHESVEISEDFSTYTVVIGEDSFVVSVAEGSGIEDVPRITVSQNEKTKTNSVDKEEIRAPLAGNVLKIEVAVGDEVRLGETLLVMEAMKMETEIQSAVAGRIESLLIREGDAIDVDQLLLIIA